MSSDNFAIDVANCALPGKVIQGSPKLKTNENKYCMMKLNDSIARMFS